MADAQQHPNQADPAAGQIQVDLDYLRTTRVHFCMP